MTQNAFDNFCIVELFGHQKIVGRVTEQTIAGQGFIRVDVPQTTRHSAFTRMFGSNAIYSITPVSAEIAQAAAEQTFVEPVTVYIEPSHQISSAEEDDYDNDFNSEDDQ